uniref:Uncharacterized protein n=1 Tax=Anguilla anguilla TaxID=7936 RepID=A0A0E9VT32_ANGAN
MIAPTFFFWILLMGPQLMCYT